MSPVLVQWMDRPIPKTINKVFGISFGKMHDDADDR
jgi:hypothetical protein